jgi:hypothetical protein
MDAHWIVARGEQRFQAPDISTLKEWLASGKLHANDQIWNPVASQWIGIRDLTQLIATGSDGTQTVTTAGSTSVSQSSGQPSASTVSTKKKSSGGCRLAAVGCGGVFVGIALTLGVEFWMVAAGVQAVKNAFSGGSSPSYSASGGNDQAPPQYDLRQCGIKRGWGVDPEDKDPGLRAACDKARAEELQRDIAVRAQRDEQEHKKDDQ